MEIIFKRYKSYNLVQNCWDNFEFAQNYISDISNGNFQGSTMFSSSWTWTISTGSQNQN